jgi:hypothetical protein
MHFKSVDSSTGDCLHYLNLLCTLCHIVRYQIQNLFFVTLLFLMFYKSKIYFIFVNGLNTILTQEFSGLTYIPWILKFVIATTGCGISHKHIKHTDKCSNSNKNNTKTK